RAPAGPRPGWRDPWPARASARTPLALGLEAVDRQHAVGAFLERVAERPDALGGSEHIAHLARRSLAVIEQRPRIAQRELGFLAGLLRLGRGAVARFEARGELVRERRYRSIHGGGHALHRPERCAGLPSA